MSECISQCPIENGEQIIQLLGFQNDHISYNFAILASMWLFYRILGYAILRLKIKTSNA